MFYTSFLAVVYIFDSRKRIKGTQNIKKSIKVLRTNSTPLAI